MTFIKINCPINRYTSKYPLNRTAIVYLQFSKLLNQPLYQQISVDVENKSVFLNKKQCSHIYIVILHVYLAYGLIYSLQKNILYGFDSRTIYQERELYQKGRETSMPIVTKKYRSWLKSAANMKLSSNASVLRITYEGITNFQSFMDFDRDSIESLSKACSK